ncbi:DUF294 nucleotidyltransferase-like domain-containing protein [Luteimonas salinilitoris]|uniref:DUF294 nucleotidyltransferase-like domain-containing protein n=1 Tax=Luteimonas salinilitoris TaxID=3237697 RepID=A0ABV4HX55_9GAMM
MTVPVDVLEFLGAQSPFSALPEQALRQAASRIEAVYRRRGEVLLDHDARNDALPLIRKGAVEVADPQGRLVLRLEEGDCFAFVSLLTGNPTRFRYTLIEDALIWWLPAQDFHALRREYPEFDRYFVRTLEERLTLAARPPQDNALFAAPLAGIASKPAAIVPADTTIRAAARQMARMRISSLLVGTPERLQGILTDRDLRNKVLAEDLDPSRPVSEIMVARPHALDAGRNAFDALLLMLDHGVHHLPVLEDGRVIGVVSSRDLLALQTEHPLYLIREVGLAPDLEALTRTLARLPELCARLLSAGADGAGLPRVLTAINDAVTRRLLALARAELGPPPGPFAWLAFGSQARGEQTLHSDQDNGLILPDGCDADTPYFRALSETVCAGLDACGQRFCDGGIMAQNPKWRLTVDGWLQRFGDWMRAPEPEALLNASIFFDLRQLAGDRDLGDALQDGLAGLRGNRGLFLGILARQVLDHAVPLGTFRRFVVESDGAHRDRLNIKRAGLLPLVELVRVRALRHGIATPGTEDRLQALARAGRIAAGDARVLAEALRVFTRLRMRHQLRQLRAGEAADNWIAPERLDAGERRALRDAFIAVRDAQSLLAGEFGTRA